MSQVEGKRSAIPADTAVRCPVISLQSREGFQNQITDRECPGCGGRRRIDHEAAAHRCDRNAVSNTAPTDGTFAIAKVPNPQDTSQCSRLSVPLPANEALTFLGVKPDIKDMTLDEKFTCLQAMLRLRLMVCGRSCARFLSQSVRSSRPTLRTVRTCLPSRKPSSSEDSTITTIYSAIQREKDRRAEDAQFFAAITAQAVGQEHSRSRRHPTTTFP